MVYCPLTDDYNYINECLNTIEEQLEVVVENNGNIPISTDEKGIDTFTFWCGGTIANSNEKGSSLVGNGLARNYFFISRFKNTKGKDKNNYFCNR